MSRRFFQSFSLFIAIVASTVNFASSQEIRFIEDFALSDDRSTVLDKLVPGTHEYYYFHALHHQANLEFEKVEELLKPWIKRFGENQQVKIIQNRQALLKFENDPAATYDFLKQRLRLNFDHQRAIPTAERNLPTKLDPKFISIPKFVSNADRRYRDTAGVLDSGLEHLDPGKLDRQQLRHLLSRLKYPDYPGLTKLVVKDLREKRTGNFGSLPIHSQLTILQLEDCLNSVPKLIDNSSFVFAYLSKLHPSDDVNWRADRTEHREYLDRLYKFTERLNPVFNSLKACVLYRRLEFDRLEGRYDRQLFLEYLQLPREVGYVNPTLTKEISSRKHIVNLSADYGQQTRLLPIQTDEALVNDYLYHLLVDARNYDQFRPYIRDWFLKRSFASAKILNGKGDKESWASTLSPQQYKQLVDRVDLEFALTNQEFFGDGDDVRVELFTKNIDKLIIKIYQINSFNYYRKHLREIDTDINLDGLVPNFEKTVQYEDDPVLRKSRKFEFPELEGNGVYVVDFIGGGKSSRALIRRGRMSMIGQTTIAGQRYRVFDHNNKQLKKASIWIAGNQYAADENGFVNVPFSNQPSNRVAVITSDGFSSLQNFRHQPETYKLDAALYVDRESLLRNQTANVIIRPALQVSGVPASVGLLKDIQVSINSTNLDGVTATKRVDDLALQDDAETVCEFVVPPRLKTITFELRCTVENISQNQKQDLLVSRTFEVNQIDASDEIQDAHLMPTASGYVLEIRGKSGEARSGQAVRVVLRHKDFKDTLSKDLQSDKNGRIELGELVDIAQLEATVAAGSKRTWKLPQHEFMVSSKLHAIYGDIIEVPAPSDLTKADREQLSLFEKRSGQLVADHFDKLKVENGRILLSELAAGDYVLRLKRLEKTVSISVIDGEGIGGVVLGQHRRGELRATTPLVIREVAVTDAKLEVGLENTDQLTRVHVIGTRYLPRFNSLSEFARVGDISPWLQRVSVRRSAYMAGRNLSDEYQYILNRRYATKFPGNMLKRPSLLMNPWSIRDTQNNVESLLAGDDFKTAGTERDESLNRQKKNSELGESARVDFANLNFIESNSIVIANLQPDKNGIVELDRDKLKGLQHIRIVAVGAVEVAQRSVSLKPTKLEIRDQRLAAALDPSDHFAQTKQIGVLKQGDTLTIEDLASGKFHYFDDLGDLFQLYLALNPNTRLAEFEFILSWSQKSAEEKRSLYSRHACHELNYYLFEKDRAFFNAVVAPHISHKMETGLIDQFLLKQNLDRYANEQWQFSKLNVFERVLLSQRLENQSDDIVLSIKDLALLNPVKKEYFDSLYDRSIRTGELSYLGFSTDDNQNGLPAFDEGGKDRNGDSLSLGINLRGGVGGGVAYGGGVPASKAVITGGFAGEVSKSPGKVAKKQMELFGAREPGNSSKSRRRRKSKQQSDYRKMDDDRDGEAFFFENGVMYELRDKGKSLYRRLTPTKEWIEQQYYYLTPAQQTPDLVSVNRFWQDYSKHTGGPFLSEHFAEPHRTLTEIMFALAVIDLPEKAPEHKFEYNDDSMTVTAAGPMIAMHQQFRPVTFKPRNTAILISENFFQKNDRYQTEDGIRFDKFVDDKFYAHTLYGAQVVITNPTSTPQAVDLLIQIPRGSVATSNSQQTRSQQMQLDAFSTKTFEYFFYFPTAGDFTHYPAHVSRDDQVLALAENVDFKVTDQPAEVDESSWAFVSQNGTEDQVMEFLASENLLRQDLTKIAFRMQNKPFYERVVDLLKRRYRYDHTIWSYAIHHQDKTNAADFLQQESRIANHVGRYLDSSLLKIEPYIRNWYQHREYSPLINARTHQVGASRQILNPAFHAQYRMLLDLLANRKELTSEDHLAVTYYLLLQDRIEEAIKHFGKVQQDDLNELIQFDYCDAYLNFFLEKPEAAEAIAKKWAKYPVDHWRQRFEQILAQVEEIRGAGAVVVDARDNQEQQTKLAAMTPSFDFEVESDKIRLTSQAVSDVEVNFYAMDIELMFSRNPFQQTNLDGFSVIKPMETQTVAIDSTQDEPTEIELPTKFENQNVLVEIRAGDQVQAHPYFANSMSVQTVEKYGQLHVTTESNKPVSKAYVKVYSRTSDGQVKFHKDGYTDLRGRFDYVTQSNNPLDGILEYSILILSPEFGATTRQVAPPTE